MVLSDHPKHQAMPTHAEYEKTSKKESNAENSKMYGGMLHCLHKSTGDLLNIFQVPHFSV